MTLDPCSRCGRTLLDLRAGASRDALRGSVPLCSVPACPLVKRVLGFGDDTSARLPTGLELQGLSPPAVFVGRYGYPKVQMGPLLPALPEPDPAMAESPADWARSLDIGSILALRSKLFRSKHAVEVDTRAAPHALEASRELAMSAKPVETEVTLSKPAKWGPLQPKVDATVLPMGPSIDVVDARVVSHPSVPRKVDSVVSDVHADAATGASELYEGGISAYHIQRLLSVGLLGETRRRKLVPTRWSITATDDILGKQLIEQVKTQPLVDAPLVYSSDLFGNYFHVLLMPRVWAYEMIESWIEAGEWGLGHDWEGHGGRSDYAASITGAYYAARLSVLEHLVHARRQAAVFVYREITDEYWAPLGVWVIREAVRTAMEGRGLAFGDVDSAVRHMLRRSRYADWLRMAKLPRETRVQKTLREFAEDAPAE